MEIVVLWVGYAFFWAAVVLGSRARSPRWRSSVVAACLIAGLCSALALSSPLVLDSSPARVLIPLWGLLSLGAVAFAFFFLRGHEKLARLLTSEGSFRWSGGQTVAPAPETEGFRYRPFGLLLIPFVVIQFMLAAAPLTLLTTEFIGVGTLLLLSPALLTHAVVLGVLGRMCHWALFSSPAA
jgi:hypothetical protein